jgi:hypothetical protein
MRTRSLLVVSLVALAYQSALAQPMVPGLPEPKLSVLVPAGGRAGTQVVVMTGGLDLDKAQGLLFSHPGLKAERLEAPTGPPISAANAQAQQRLINQEQNRPMMPRSWAHFLITVPAELVPGLYDVRVVTPQGLSNPRAFVVGDQPQQLEVEPNDDVPQAQRIEVDSVVFGDIPTPLDVDLYVFAGRKGQRVLINGLSTSLDSRLELSVELYDASGRPLATNHGYRDNDVLADAVLPADADYYVRVHHFTHTRGGPDQTYLLNLTTAPWIDAVFPAVVEAGKTTTVTVWGRNLPGGRPDPEMLLDGVVLERLDVPVDTTRENVTSLRTDMALPPVMSGVDGFDFRLRNDAGSSNPAFLGIVPGPVVLEAGHNDRPEEAQALTLPCDVAGRIESRGDRDWYRFDARKGDVLSIEAWGDRLGAPVDLYFMIRSVDGKQMLVDVDENTDVFHQGQFYNRTDDPPRQRLVAPADGTYTLMISAREATVRSDPRYVYRLRIGPERPDFRLVAMPASTYAPEAAVLRAEGKVEYVVFAWRIDGFDAPIMLSAEGLPPGVTVISSGIGTGLKQGSLVLTTTAETAAWDGPIIIKGTAQVRGETVERVARAATISWPGIMQANLPALVRLDRLTVLSVRPGKAPFALSYEGDRQFVTQGAKLEVPLKLLRIWPDVKGPVQVASSGLPMNLNFGPMSLTPGNEQAKFSLNVPANTPPGEYRVVFRGQTNFQYSPDPEAKQKPNILVTAPSNPVPLVIAPRELAKLSLQPPAPSVRPGERVEVTVKVARQFNFGGELRVEFARPPEAKGLSAEPVVIPAGQDEAKLVILASADAAPGNRGNLAVKATGTFLEGVPPIAQEIKFQVNVTK